jgi:hypothetical protein
MGKNDLGTFDGADVRSATIAVTNAGDGLSKAMKVEPEIFHLGDRVYVVLECEVSKISHVPIDDGADLSRVHVLRAGNATIVDETLVREAIEMQVRKIVDARDDETGAMQLHPVDVKAIEHANGLHKRKRKDCPACNPDPLNVDGADEDDEPDDDAHQFDPDTEEPDEVTAKRTRKATGTS